jgi:hypothetical protein
MRGLFQGKNLNGVSTPYPIFHSSLQPMNSCFQNQGACSSPSANRWIPVSGIKVLAHSHQQADGFLFPESRCLLLVIVKGQVILLFPINCPLLRVDRHPYIEYVFLTAFLRLMGKSRRFLRRSNNVFTLEPIDKNA